MLKNDWLGPVDIALLLEQLVNCFGEEQFEQSDDGVGAVEYFTVRSPILGQLEHLRWVKHRLQVRQMAARLVEDRLEVVESEADALGDGLGSVSREEDVLLRHRHQERDHVLCQVLHLVDH